MIKEFSSRANVSPIPRAERRSPAVCRLNKRIDRPRSVLHTITRQVQNEMWRKDRAEEQYICTAFGGRAAIHHHLQTDKPVMKNEREKERERASGANSRRRTPSRTSPGGRYRKSGVAAIKRRRRRRLSALQREPSGAERKLSWIETSHNRWHCSALY